MSDYTPEQLSFLIQFQHPEKILAGLPVTDAMCAALWEIDEKHYRTLRDGFTERARQTAAALLADPAFAALVDRLPFAPESTVVGVGDSITDDYQSWFEILRHLIALRRPHDEIKLVNVAISGDTSSQMISRFYESVVLREPAWIIFMGGTNDARRHGAAPTKILVSVEETAKNLAMLRNFAATQTNARWVWLTPASVIEEQIAAHWYLGPLQLRWRNADLAAVANIIRQQRDTVIDLQRVFGVPPRPELLLSDGLHPSLEGQREIVKALVTQLAQAAQGNRGGTQL